VLSGSKYPWKNWYFPLLEELSLGIFWEKKRGNMGDREGNSTTRGAHGKNP